MKSCLVYFFFVGVVFSNDSLKSQFLSRGFPAKVSIEVIDQDNNPLSGAQVQTTFTFLSQNKPIVSQHQTDSSGMVTVESFTNDGIVIQVQKEGYYHSSTEYKVWKNKDSFKTGRWEPWNPTIKIELLKLISPKRKQFVIHSFRNLEPQKEYGFDFVKGTLVDPKEDHQYYDFLFSTSGSIYSSDAQISGDWDKQTRITFTNKDDGIIEKEKNSFSAFMYMYQAPESGYESKIEFVIKKENSVRSQSRSMLKSPSFYVLHVSRSSIDGEMFQYYGIIQELNIGRSWKTGKPYFYIIYCLNPEPDDRNIEYYY